jgi:tetratricopeptide (TPR) repeat protein
LLYEKAGRKEQAAAHLATSLPLWESLCAQNDVRAPAWRHSFADDGLRLGVLLRGFGREAEALPVLEQSVKNWREIASDGSVQTRQSLAQALFHFGAAHSHVGHSEDAARAFREAGDLYERLCEECPSAPNFRSALATTQHALGNALSTCGQLEAAVSAYRRARALRAERAQAEPSNVHYQSELAGTEHRLSEAIERLESRATLPRQQATGLPASP